MLLTLLVLHLLLAEQAAGPNTLRYLALEPRAATLAGAKAAGWPEFATELVSICKRESPGHDCSRRVGLHGNDSPQAVRRFYRKAVARGWLDPDRCPAHRAETFEEMRRFGVHGSHGLAAAYSLRFLGIDCAAPEALDNPFLSAVAATRRAAAMCARRKACSRATRHALWMGEATARRRGVQEA